ncbi:MAG: hypothetical protein ACOX66_01565 [Oscillospiraceae bacterium]|jgi:hypothetical protein
MLVQTMKDNAYADNQIADEAEYSLDEIIAEVKAEEGFAPPASPVRAEPERPLPFADGGPLFEETASNEASRPAQDAMDDKTSVPEPTRRIKTELSRYKKGFSNLRQAFTDEFLPQPEEEPVPQEFEMSVESAPQPSGDPEAREQALSDVERIFGVDLSAEKQQSVGGDAAGLSEGSPSPASDSGSDAADPDATRRWEVSAGDGAAEHYAPARDYESEASDLDAEEPEGPGFREKVVLPILGLFADAAAKREERRKLASARAERERENRPPELAPEAAARLYADQAQSLRMRAIFASAVCAVLVWLSYGLPAAGILGSSVRIATFTCLILELTVMVIGLDIFANGLRTLFQKRPGSESLIAVSCVVSLIDAVCIIVFETYKVGFPFCAVSALSLTAALWGYYFSCKSFALSFLTAARSQTPTVILSEDGGEENGRVLVHVRRPVTGFVRSSEEADLFEKTYLYFAPILLIFALVLSLVCFAASKDCDNFPHTLAAAVSISASLSTVLGFAFPFYIVTKRLARSGVAVAGCAGASELGHIHRVVLKDKDLFPVRTISIANISIEEGFYPDRVTSYTASMIAAAGLGIAPVFMELMKKNAYTMKPIEDFSVQESGGLIARVGGDLVYVGPAAFLKLMGVHVGKGAASKTAVCTAINDTLAGIFEINYAPVASVQRGLLTLLRGGMEPVFAVRDFNITPTLVQQKFRLPRKNYEFPSYATRYRISSDETEEEGTVAAVFPRGGLNAVSGLIRRGRKLYRSLIVCDVISVLGSFVGMVMMLTMCWQGVWSSASCANAMSFMLLWLVPVFVVSYGLKD